MWTKGQSCEYIHHLFKPFVAFNESGERDAAKDNRTGVATTAWGLQLLIMLKQVSSLAPHIHDF